MRQMILRVLDALRKATLAARRGFLRAAEKVGEEDGAQQAPPSARPITALVPTVTSANGGKERRAWSQDELRPSQVRLSRRIRLKLAKHAIIACLALSLLCVIAVPVLSSVKIKHIRVEGAVHYSVSDIVLATGVSVGDELFKHDLKEIEARLLNGNPYLLSVRVRRSGAGLSILLTESTPRWALALSDGRVALMDGNGYICDVREQSDIPQGLSALHMPLPMLASEEQEGELQEQIVRAGAYIKGSSPTLTLFARLTLALEGVSLPSPLCLVDLDDIYSVTLTLENGTRLLLHDCADPERQLDRAVAALESYSATHPDASETHDLAVDVDEYFRVSIRSVPKDADAAAGEAADESTEMAEE